ncbi:hypothetical protein ACS0VI_02785 [Streptomyces sp. H28]|uniref:hypothetical protein n=1 Tax=Streptomyces sp. H28 TaxID=2775865 RepID=UPI001CE1CE1A|nr:hypothetical protein [Streptomyces sp. H28]
MPETAGETGRELPAFTPEEGSYTIYASCDGKGEVSIVGRDSGKPHPIACGGVLTVGVVHVEKEEEQHIRIEVVGGAAAWRVAVVSGDRQA